MAAPEPDDPTIDNIGMKVSQLGYDVLTTGDENLTFSSSWPTLKIYKQGSFTISDDSLEQTITSHGLGYNPAFWVFINDVTLGVGINANNFMFWPSPEFGVNTTELRYFPQNVTGEVITGHYMIFTTDLTVNYDAPIIKTAGEQEVIDNDFGFKASDPGVDVNTAVAKDMVITSSMRTPMVQKIHTQAYLASSGIISIPHGLPYAPLFYSYGKGATIDPISGTDYWRYLQSDGATTSITTDPDTLNFGASGDLDFTVIICKDPFTLTDTTTVSI